MDIIELIGKYNLTLRKLPSSVLCGMALNEHNLDYVKRKNIDYRITEEIVKSNCTEEQFEWYVKNRNYHPHKRLSNGFVIDKFIRYSEQRKGGWACLIDTSYGSTQHFNGDKCFFANTPEIAVKKAVEFIEEQNKEHDEKYKAAGLI